ncbi:MAG: glycosyltransferase [Candidatus Thorarchaeota archaeon]
MAKEMRVDPMLRVVMLVTNDVNPDPRVEKEAMSLFSRGVNVIIVGTGGQPRQLPDTVASRVPIMRLQLSEPRWLSRKPGWIRSLFRLSQYNIWCLRKSKDLLAGTSVIHANDFDTLPVAWLLSRMSGAKLVYDVHEIYTGMFSPTVPRIIVIVIDAVERILSKKADLILTTGLMMVKRMNSLTGRRAISLRNVPSRNYGMGVVRKKPDRFTVGYVGGLLEDRNLEELIEAFKCFNKSCPESSLVIAGWGPLSTSIQDHAKKSDGKIIFLGKLPATRVPHTLASCSIAVVFTSKRKINHYYACANKVFEAAAVGTPVLATDIGELGTVVKEYSLGFVTDSDSVRAIVCALRQIASRDDLEEIGRHARKVFEDHFCWELYEPHLLSAYNELFSSVR